MTPSANSDMVFPHWNDKHGAVWGHQPVKLDHALHRSPLFTFEALADLIDHYPREHYSLIHMGGRGGRRFWREGDIAGMKGAEVIDWIRNGRMWLNLRNVNAVDRRYGALLDAAYQEVALRAPGAPMFDTKMGILISSPLAQVYYHADLPGQALWQIHGKKRLYVYPRSAPFLRPEDLENIALFGVEVDMPYHDWYDEFAQVFDLDAGDMAHWPLNAPHRVENLDCLNVSVTTEHWTRDIVRRHKVNVANGLLRTAIGHTPRSRAITGPGYWTKAAMQAVMRRTRWISRQRAQRREIAFRLDPQTRGGIIELGTPAE